MRQRLESLPQELYDQIYNLTFTAEPGERKIRQSQRLGYHVLSGRQIKTGGESGRPFCGHDSIKLFLIDRASSRLFAKSYYGGRGAVFTLNGNFDCRRWLQDLSHEHRQMPQDIRVVVSTVELARSVRMYLESVFGMRIASKLRVGSAKKVSKLGIVAIGRC